MKSFKLFLIVAAFSTAVVAEDALQDSLFTKAYNTVSAHASSAYIATGNALNSVKNSDGFTTYITNPTSAVVDFVSKNVKAASEKATAFSSDAVVYANENRVVTAAVITSVAVVTYVLYSQCTKHNEDEKDTK